MSENDPKLSRIYREASTEGPPTAIDAAILAAARQQIAKQQRPARSSWSRWMLPASALATLALGVSLALLVEREQPESTRDAATRRLPPRPESPPPARATQTAKPKAAPPAAEKKETPAAAAPAPAANLPAPPAQAPAPPPIAPAPSAAESFPAERRAKAAAPAIAPESNVAGDSALGGAGAPAAPAAAGKLAPLRQHSMQRSPQAWLEEIGRLKREGRDQEASEQLAEFRNAYPAYAVPDNLLK